MSKNAIIVDPCIRQLFERLGYRSLYPPQEQALSKGLLERKNLLVTTPTASGKTIIALIAAINILRRGQKVIYLTPLRALTTEKFQDFRILEELETLGRRIKVKVASSDYSSNGRSAAGADVLVLTNEKMDSLLRHRVSWIHEVGLFVVDEVHLLGERERGPTLEMMLTRIRKLYSGAQLLALSATVENSKEIAAWLGCDLVDSKWRPSKLVEGVYEQGLVRFNDGRKIRIEKSSMSGGSNSAIDIAVECIADGGQAIIFGETRKRAVSLAEKVATAISRDLDAASRKSAAEVSSKIAERGDDTEITRTLAEVVSKGVGFHHAGLGAFARDIVEKSFKSGIIRLLTATPTLASGVNLPARRVILSSIFRYDGEYGGNLPISVLEYKQICGRAGRPRYDAFGEAVIVSDSRISSEEIYDHYILGTPEPITSQLANDRSIRIHLLSTISSMPGIKKSQVYELFASTLLAHTKGYANIAFKLDSAIVYLEKESLIKCKNERYIATEFGREISLLYIDPLTGIEFRRVINSIENAFDTQNRKLANARDRTYGLNGEHGQRHTLGLLNIICNCPDFYPKISLRKKDIEEFFSDIEQYRDEDLFSITENDSSRSLWALHKWINESTDRVLSDRIGVEPGDMHRIVEVAEWLTYSLYEVAKILKRGDLLPEFQNLRLRIKHGVKEELLALVRLKGIGRVRARSLFTAGFSDTSKILTAAESHLSAVSNIGPGVAKSIKEQLQTRRV
jgi:helicase